MHELSLMSGIIDIVKQYTQDLEGRKVTKVKLLVGRLTNAVPEALEFAFEAFVKDTELESAQLEIEIVPLVVKCHECGFEATLEQPVFRCPKCTALGLTTVSGRELRVESLEVE